MNLVPWKNKQREANALDRTDASWNRMRSEIDRMFERFFAAPWFGDLDPSGARGAWLPAVDMTETESEITVRAELPGIDPKEIEVNLSGRMLTVSGEKRESNEQRGENFHQIERRFGSFRRTIELPAEVDPDRVAADYKQGVLQVSLKKVGASRTKRVPIKSAD
jgi:HSP20 family protein